MIPARPRLRRRPPADRLRLAYAALLVAIVAAGIGLGLAFGLVRPAGPGDFLARGDAFASQFAFSDAAGEYLKARSQVPDDPAIALRLARVYRARGDFDAATAELVTALSSPVTRAPALLEAGDLAQLRGDPVEARIRWQAAAEAAPGDPAPVGRLATRAVQDRDFPAARDHLARLVSLTPADAPARYRLALVTALTDRVAARDHLSALDDQAPAVVRRRAAAFAAALDPADRASRPADADLLLGQAYLDAGEIGLAEAAFERALALDPGLHAARSRLAYVLTQTGDPGRAGRLAEAAREADPQDPLAWEALGLARRAAGDLAGARETFAEAERRFPDDPLFPAELGNTLIGLGDGLGAEPKYNRAVELAPTEPAFLTLQAKFYLDRAWQVDRGLQAAWRAEELRPDDAEVKDLVGWGHYLKRDHQTAVEKLHEAIRLEPTLATAHYHLAVVLESTGHYGPARVEYEKARDLARDRALRDAAAGALAKLPGPGN